MSYTETYTMFYVNCISNKLGGGAKKPKVQLYQMRKPFQVHVLNRGPLNCVS